MAIKEGAVATAIAVTREKLATLDSEKIAEADKNLAIDFEEHFKYQQLQAEAHAMQVLSTSDARIVYNALGEVGSADNGGWAEGTDPATKYAVTMLMGKLLDRKIAGAR